MIIEYHRPENLEQARRLLNRKSPVTIPLGGGTIVSRLTEIPVAVVDLQALGLNKIVIDSDRCKLGAMVRIQDIIEHPGIPVGMVKATRRETNINLRRVATIGGVLTTSDGRSPLLGSFLACDTKVFWDNNPKPVSLEEWLKNNRQNKSGKLITGIEFTRVEESDYDDVARSPEDKPLLYVTYSKWSNEGIRVVYGGAGNSPVLHTGSTKKLINEIIERITRSSIPDDLQEYTAYQKSAIKVLIDRLVPGNGKIDGKDSK